MNTKLKKIKIILWIFLFIFSTQLWAGIQLVAGRGQPADDFPPDFIYKDIKVRSAVIGASGHVAFSGIADTTDSSSSSRTNVIWSGLPGQLKAIIKENESPEGLPDNVLFDKLSTLAGRIIVNRFGDVGLRAEMKGAAQGKEALLLHINGGTTLSVLMEGTQAPGFPPGVIVVIINDFKLSEAGMVILAQVVGGSSSGTALWFHDFEKMTLLPSPIPGCSLTSLTTSVINDSGEIVLGALLDGNTCTQVGRGIFKWHNSQWETIVFDGQSVPSMEDTVFSVSSSNLQFGPSINDQGEIAFSAGIRKESSPAQNQGIWVIGGSSDAKLLILGNEILANNSSDIISSFSNFSFFGFTNNGFSIMPVFTPTGENALLAGRPRNNQPYTNPDDTGTSQLSVVAQKNKLPPGFTSTWFYLAAGESLALNRGGQYIYTGSVSDAATGNQNIALWRASENTNPRLKAMAGMKVTINNKDHILGIDSASFSDLSMTIGGRPARFSDNGHFLFDGTLSGGPSGLFLLLDDSREQKIFTLAEQLFPQFFAPANADDRLLEGFEYRFYPDTNTYIGIKNGEVFVLGGAFGSDVKRIGTIDETLRFLEEILGS